MRMMPEKLNFVNKNKICLKISNVTPPSTDQKISLLGGCINLRVLSCRIQTHDERYNKQSTASRHIAFRFLPAGPYISYSKRSGYVPVANPL
jgi:hypothetical protein